MGRFVDLVKHLLPNRVREAASLVRHRATGTNFVASWPESPPGSPATASPTDNPLRAFFDARHTGHGIWKWQHYFDIYHRYLSKFRGRPVSLVEIGIYSGGSLDMWRDYFGDGLTLHGVDIQPECKSYERPGVQIHIGDQADRGFWRTFRSVTGPIDVIIDDGGHTPEQQRITLEETLPYLRPGGVYICEDIHGRGSAFSTYVSRLADELNASQPARGHGPERHVYTATSPFQAAINAVHIYPFVVVIEKREAPLGELFSARHGTEWQPFLGPHPERVVPQQAQPLGATGK